MNNTHRRMMSRKRREAIKRRRIAVGSIAVVLIIIIIAVILSVKGCSSRNTDSDNNAINSNDTASTDINNANSANEADASGSTQDTSKSGQANLEQTDTSSDNSDSSSGKTIGVSSNGYSIIEKDGVTYVGGVLIANKSYSLPKTFIPQDPDQPVNADRSSTCLDKTLMSAWRTMQKDATAQGLNIYIASGYRSYNYQVNVYNRYVSSDGKAAADTYSSRPGYSEHQTGLCFDLNSIEDSFQYTNEGKWVNDNCYKYGFCIRFPKGKDKFTGYKYESWHLRYVGVDLATKLYNNGDWLSLEEYFGITSEYSD